MFRAMAELFYRLPRAVQRPFESKWYEWLSRLDREADMTFMNYGWASLDPTAQALILLPEDELNRYCIQLYHRVAGAVDLSGLDVLEVGCGRGGGASYVMRYLKPASMTGLDLTAGAIAFCREHYAIPGLTFVQGRAGALEFDAGRFDAVINVESSHCYSDVGRFLGGVYRVLKPGGYLLFADLRDKGSIALLRRQFRDAGLTPVEEEDIGANVVRALELDDARKRELIERNVPRVLRSLFNEFAGMEGTRSSYAALRSGDKVYLRSVLRK